MKIIAQELNIDTPTRHILCMGHVVNLVAHQVLFGSDIESFEHELENVIAEEVELRSWRSKGPIGKLHNLIRYILHSSKRRDVFIEIQQQLPTSLRDQHDNPDTSYDLIRDNLTRWNSWYDAAIRAIELRPAINEFIDNELDDYNVSLAKY
jgi:hypothetical protein